MVHPCRSLADTGGNPKYKMHACATTDSTQTVCGLPQVIDVNVLAGYTSLCRTCFAQRRETPWTNTTGDQGDVVSGRLEEGELDELEKPHDEQA